MSFLFVELVLSYLSMDSENWTWVTRPAWQAPLPKPFLSKLSKPQSSLRALVMLWLVSWHHFCSSSHIVISNGSDGQRSEIAFNFTLLVKNNWPKLHFPEVYFYIQSWGLPVCKAVSDSYNFFVMYTTFNQIASWRTVQGT